MSTKISELKLLSASKWTSYIKFLEVNILHETLILHSCDHLMDNLIFQLNFVIAT